jgi:hypothetical protein
MYRVMWVFVFSLMISVTVFAQIPDRNVVLGTGGGSYILFGDLLVDEGKDQAKKSQAKPLLYEVVLNNRGERPAGRQYVNAGGRYQFINIAPGQYDLVVLLDHQEVARIRVEILAGPAQERIRQDISLAWKSTAPAKATSVSAEDFYQRSESNEQLLSEREKQPIKSAMTMQSQLCVNS